MDIFILCESDIFISELNKDNYLNYGMFNSMSIH